MKKFAWLLVLPYVVTVSSEILDCSHIDTSTSTVKLMGDCQHPTYTVGHITFFDKDEAEDLAEALNNAHQRRTHPADTPEMATDGTVIDPAPRGLMPRRLQVDSESK